MRYCVNAAAFFVALFLVPFSHANAQSTVSGFPDFLAVRAEFLSAVVTANPARTMAFRPVYRDSPAGRVRVSVEKDGTSLYVLFLRERAGAYPYGSRGNVILQRDAETGYLTRMIWFLSDDGTSFLRLTPKNERTVVDYVVAGAVVKSGLSVSRLAYYFITNSFGYLYDATRSAIDWSLALGPAAPDSASDFVSSLASGHPSGPAAELVRAALDFGAVDRYLAAAGVSDSAPVEVTAVPYSLVAICSDPRDPAFVAVPEWSAERGLAIESLGGAVIDGIGSAYLGFVAGRGDQSSRRLAIVPHRDDAGSFVVTIVDAQTLAQVDGAVLVASLPGASIRLFRVPLPATR